MMQAMGGMPGMPGMMAPPTTTPPPAPPPPEPEPQAPAGPGGFRLPGHLSKLLPNGIPSSSGITPADLMTLASAGLGSANPHAAPRDIMSIIGATSPMQLFGGMGGMGAMMGGMG